MIDPRGNNRARARLVATAAGATVLAAGLAVRGLSSGAAAKYAGDALYTVLLCALVVALAPRLRPAVAAGVGLAASWAVEFSQLGDLPAELSRRSTLARLVLGSTFNAPDLFWYAVGALLALLIHTVAVRRTAGDRRRG